MAIQYLISLFTIMLCFFIVLNTFSTYEKHKYGQVAFSLSHALSPETQGVPGDLSSVLLPVQSNAEMNDGGALHQIEGIFNAQIPALDITQNRFGNAMRVTLAQTDFDNATTDTVLSGSDPDNQGLRPILLALMRARDTNPLRMDITLGLGQDPGDMAQTSPDKMIQARAKAAAIATRLEAAGLPPDLMTVGLASTTVDTITLSFHEQDKTAASRLIDLIKGGG